MSEPSSDRGVPVPHGAGRAPATPSAETALAQAREALHRYERLARAEATWRAYASDWRRFEAWARTVGRETLPTTPETLALFLAAEAARGRAPSTVTRRVSAIRLVHLGAGLPSPTDAVVVSETLRGIRRGARGRAPAKREPAVDHEIKRMADALDDDRPATLRDRALILLGFASALRRSELAGMTIEWLRRHPKGLVIEIPYSKADQEGHGQTVAVPAKPDSPWCPVAALDRWLAAADIRTGAVFRAVHRSGRILGDDDAHMDGKSIARIVKRVALAAGLDPTRRSAHSLRRGVLTSAAHAGSNIARTQRHARHTSFETTAGYFGDGELFEDHPLDDLLEP